MEPNKQIAAYCRLGTLPHDTGLMLFKRYLPGRVRAARDRQGMTQKELAELAGVSRMSIIGVEGGQCAHLRVSTLILIGTALGLSLDQLAGIDKPDDVRQGIRREMFPLRAAAGGAEMQKCFACDSLLSIDLDHTEAACILANHDRDKNPLWLAGFYGVTLEWVFDSLVQEQRRVRNLGLVRA